ncbi:MAG TPA: DUF4124 domain-containing protein, partial [Thermodesulfovibrionales bacterium]|nr:DUF4124 domain-containing protein [Thermodesulfovibrionales bacterium]
MSRIEAPRAVVTTLNVSRYAAPHDARFGGRGIFKEDQGGFMKRMQAVVLAVVLCVLHASPGAAAIYKYVDKNGTPSFVDSLDAVPEKYRKDAVRVSGRAEDQEKQSAKELKTRTPEEGKTEKESFINKAKEYAGALSGNRAVVFFAMLAGFIVLFVAFGKIAESLN